MSEVSLFLVSSKTALERGGAGQFLKTVAPKLSQGKSRIWTWVSLVVSNSLTAAAKNYSRARTRTVSRVVLFFCTRCWW